MTKKHYLSRIIFILLATPIIGFGQKTFQLSADLDPLVTLPSAYSLTPEKLTKLFPKNNFHKNPYFQWLTKDRTRAIFKRQPAGNVTVNLTVLGGKIPVQEVIVDFKDGQYLGIFMSVYNRGDAKDKMTSEAFDKTIKGLGRHIGSQLDTTPQTRKGNVQSGLLTKGYNWFSARGMAVLEYNPEATNGSVKFVRLRLCKRDARGPYAAALKSYPAPSVRTSSLPSNIVRTSQGNVYINNIPMVDQGAKGYCVVASAQRVFEYFGIPCDMHQLAELCGSDPELGTDSLKTARELGAIVHKFRMRYDALAIRHRDRLRKPLEKNGTLYVKEDIIDSKDHKKIIQKYIDRGMPILWSLQLGIFPEEPAISQQASGGHMRLIIGYNDKSKKILFSDSWGAGHEVKSMDESHAMKATTALFVLRPINN